MKKILILIAILWVVAWLSACGSKKAQETQESQSTTNTFIREDVSWWGRD